jgi:hypothetical protein
MLMKALQKTYSHPLAGKNSKTEKPRLHPWPLGMFFPLGSEIGRSNEKNNNHQKYQKFYTYNKSKIAMFVLL